MGKKSPKPPSPATIAKAEQVNQITPFSSTTFSVGDDGRAVATSAPRGQFAEVIPGLLAGKTLANLDNTRTLDQTIAALNAGGANSQSLRAGLSDLGRPEDLVTGLGNFGQINLSGLPGLDTDFAEQSARAEQATFDRALNLLQPQLDLQRRRAERRLVDQGIDPNSEAAIGETTGLLTALNRDQGQQLENLALSSILAGNQRQNELFSQSSQARGQLFGEQGTVADLLDRQRSQQFGENQGVFDARSRNRAQQFGENQAIFDRVLQKQLALSDLSNRNLSNAFGLVQPANIPGSSPGTNAAQQGFQNQFAANQSRNQGLSSLGTTLGLGTAAGLGAAGASGGLAGAAGIGASLAPLLFLSDIRIKHNIVKQGKVNGFNTYEFSYDGDDARYIGVMAQEVEKIKPEAVVEINGIKSVNYNMINVPFMRA